MENGSKEIIVPRFFSENVGRFDCRGKILLIPEMNRIGARLLAASFRGFGISAKVMDTCKGLNFGQEYTSGKECYPCQITTGDILYFMKEEKDRLGNNFHPENYVYFMPESSGPCRFGMYNKYQRIVLDSFHDLKKVKIGTITTDDGYSLAGIIEERRVKDLKKVCYFSVVVGDVLDRLLWRIRPYEKEYGMADKFIERVLISMEKAFVIYGGKTDLDAILDMLCGIIEEGKEIIDPDIPPKPRIGIVGEIYLRSHVHANQDVIRTLEKFGAEVVNASIAEWVNYATYDALRSAGIDLRINLKRFCLNRVKENFKEIVNFGMELFFQERIQDRVYKRVRSLIDLAQDHKVGHLEEILKENDLFCFDVGTEACLSIPGVIQYIREGFDGVVNVYPFTCMPSTITSAIVKPLMARFGIPYLDTAYDSSTQPGREAAIRTFMYQADQHFKRNGVRYHG
jgi:predicted nucleotide-binding protein (sugar kinase/HSP70/actin superfamily)